MLENAPLSEHEHLLYIMASDGDPPNILVVRACVLVSNQRGPHRSSRCGGVTCL